LAPRSHGGSIRPGIRMISTPPIRPALRDSPTEILSSVMDQAGPCLRSRRRERSSGDTSIPLPDKGHGGSSITCSESTAMLWIIRGWQVGVWTSPPKWSVEQRDGTRREPSLIYWASITPSSSSCSISDSSYPSSPCRTERVCSPSPGAREARISAAEER